MWFRQVVKALPSSTPKLTEEVYCCNTHEQTVLSEGSLVNVSAQAMLVLHISHRVGRFDIRLRNTVRILLFHPLIRLSKFCTGKKNFSAYNRKLKEHVSPQNRPNGSFLHYNLMYIMACIFVF